MLPSPQTEDLREVRLLDGRTVAVDLAGRTRIPTDLGEAYFDFSWRQPGFAWHEAVSDSILVLLRTRSTVYASQCARFAGNFAVALSERGLDRPVLDVAQVGAFPDIMPPTAWPFVRALLNRPGETGAAWLGPELQEF